MRGVMAHLSAWQKQEQETTMSGPEIVSETENRIKNRG